MPEPYRIRVVEPLPFVTLRTRRRVIKAAGYNPFLLPAKYVMIDLISDSGTGAMTTHQWAAMLRTREDFAGQESYEEFTKQARRLTGFSYIQPVHQGRSAENILFKILLKPGDVVLANTHFETTRCNIEALGCRAVDLPSDEPPFLGNIDITRLKKSLMSNKAVRMVILTCTNNIKGGQPVSLENITETGQITQKHGIPLILDASRFADNAYLIKEHSRLGVGVKTICQRMFAAADIVYLSCKKDGLVNIGGFIGMRSRRLYDKLINEVIRQEAYPTSGGLAARDIAAMSLGLVDALHEDFLRAHISSVRYLAEVLKKNDVRIIEPVGGHAVVVMPRKGHRYFSFALAAQVFLKTGVRGGVFEECFRLAIPRRVYTKDQLRYAGESIASLYGSELPGLRLVNRPREFFNFRARFTRS